MASVKSALRRQVLSRSAAQPAPDRAARSAAIRRSLVRTEAYRAAQTVCCYVSLEPEVDTWPLLRRILADGKELTVPVLRPGRDTLEQARVTDPDDELARTGWQGTYRPKTLAVPSRNWPDLVIVPGVAFDDQGNRIGRGAGHYDRFLAVLPLDTTIIGLAFAWQIVPAIPAENHDIPMHRVVSA